MQTHRCVYEVELVSHKGIKCVVDLVGLAEMSGANGKESMGKGRHIAKIQ